MSRPTFYRLGLLIPYVFPLLAILLWGVLDALPGFLITLIGLTFFSAFVWAIPYLRIVAVLLIWSRGRPAGRIRQAFLLAPVLLAAAVAIFSMFFSEAGGRLASMAAVAGLTLLIGYGLVVAWLGLQALLSHLGAFHSGKYNLS